MNVHELPMIVFTILAQMSVGAFVVLGVIQLGARLFAGATADELDRVTDPALYAIGVTLTLGLVASIFHMNDVTNVLNVFRHVGSSWLSREIVFGMGFAGLGFAFAAVQWFKWGSPRLRQALALVTAIVGLGLVYSMSMIYYSLTAVPAWSTWVTPVQFFTTTFLLGALAIGAALMSTVMWRRRRAQAADRPVVGDPRSRRLILASLSGIAMAAIVLLGIEFVVTPLYLTALSEGSEAAATSAAVYSGAWFVARLLFVFLGAGLLGLFLTRFAGVARDETNPDPRPLAIVATSAFAFVLAGEFIGRTLFYESMFRIGV